jgi:hypothetical protein
MFRRALADTGYTGPMTGESGTSARLDFVILRVYTTDETEKTAK